MELNPINKTPLGKTSNEEPPVDQFGQINRIPQDNAHIGEPPSVSNSSHYRADTDSSQSALHHSLGTGRNQATPGNHVHDGITSKKIGSKVFDTTPGKEGKLKNVLSISGSRGGNAALASVIALLKNFVDFDDNTTA